ncbi:protein of unknown function [Micropruina glycogenica]|uniref:Uncharacterized protein n=1 Tax=Micropruina glycogenica TaxID=75385 RepID=A0A2N9JDP0_9ACTN|nr:protein of unknown function [Micropruina glycogenica]
MTRYDRQDAMISAASWGLSGAEIPACEPVAPAVGTTSRIGTSQTGALLSVLVAMGELFVSMNGPPQRTCVTARLKNP